MNAAAVLNQSLEITNTRLGIVCPMANEGPTAVAFVNEVLEQCQSQTFKSVTFFAILDNASKDNTLEVLRQLENEQPVLRVVWAPENKGVVDAYVRGYREALAAECDWILEIDAGFSHQPSDIPQFFQRMAQGYACVFGSRFCAGGRIESGSFKRRIISRGGSVLSNAFLGTKLKDMTSGFELFSRPVLQEVLARGIRSRGPFFQTEIKAYCRDLRTVEVPILYRVPSHNLNNSTLTDAFVNLWRLFGLRVSGRL
jgi:dolichol-phosphate mannosyltransferase